MIPLLVVGCCWSAGIRRALSKRCRPANVLQRKRISRVVRTYGRACKHFKYTSRYNVVKVYGSTASSNNNNGVTLGDKTMDY